MVAILVKELTDEMVLKDSQIDRWVLSLDAKHYLNNLNVLWNKITKFSERNFERYFLTVGFRVIIIDNIDAINPLNQQGMTCQQLTYWIA